MNKKQLTQEATDRATSVIEKAQEDSLEVWANARRQEYYFKTLAKNLEESALEERERYGEKRLELYGATFEIGQTGDRLDYDKDPEISRLKALIKSRELLVKQASKNPNTALFDEDGAQVEPVPVKTYSKTTLKISF